MESRLRDKYINETPGNGGTYGGNGGINTNNTRFVANSFPENGTNTIGSNILTSLQGPGTGGKTMVVEEVDFMEDLLEEVMADLVALLLKMEQMVFV